MDCRVGENASAGTDHGTALPIFLVGGRRAGWGLRGLRWKQYQPAYRRRPLPRA